MLKKPPKMPTIKTKAVRKKTPAPKRRGSSVTSHSYDAKQKILSVTFHHGKTYHYQDVPKDIANEFSKAESRGSFLIRHIIGKFNHKN